MTNQELIMTYYWRISDIWKRLCEEHATLYELTLQEYNYLLESDVDSIEEVVELKNQAINTIASLDKMRSDVILEMNNQFQDINIGSVSDLINFLKVFENKLETPHLERFNNYLIDIIERIQDQNKKNQVFINKTLLSLKSIREDAIGKKNYSTYNSKGSTTNAGP